MSAGPRKAIHAMLEQAFAQLKEGWFESAIEAFNACLLMSSAEAEAFRGRAMAKFQLKDWPGAAGDFRQARDLNPDDRENWIGWGLSLAMDNQVYPAIEIFETLLEKHPDFARGRIQLGMLYLKIGVISKGREHLQKALTQRPSLAERRQIEAALGEQEKLDRKRYYRPDFEALRKQKKGN